MVYNRILYAIKLPDMTDDNVVMSVISGAALYTREMAEARLAAMRQNAEAGMMDCGSDPETMRPRLCDFIDKAEIVEVKLKIEL